MTRRTIIVEGPLALRARRWMAARRSEMGVHIGTLPVLAARLAGGFYRPALAEDLEPAINEALAAGGFTEIEAMRQLPGMTRSVTRTLTDVWSADVDLTTMAPTNKRLADLALIERRVRDGLANGVLAPRELRDVAMTRVQHAAAVLGPIELDRLSIVVPVWRPLLRALQELVPLRWVDPAAADIAWFPGAVIADPTVPPAVSPAEVVSCADPHAEVIEALRWARHVVSSGRARPEDIAICAAATEPWDEHFVTLTMSAELPFHFSNGVPALSTREGQACGALADVLLRGLSQDRIRRLLGHTIGRCSALEALPPDWAKGLQSKATLFQLEHWERALNEAATCRGESIDPAPILLPVLQLLAQGHHVATQAGDALLGAAAKALWLRALSAAPAEALEFSLQALRVSDGTDPCSSIVWCPASHLVGAPRPWVRLLGLNSGSWPRHAGEDPLLPDHVLARRVIDADSITNRDRRAFQRITARGTQGCVLSRSRRDAQGRPLSASPLLVPCQASRSLQRGRIPDHAFSVTDRLLARPQDAAASPRIASAMKCWHAWNTAEVTAHDGRVRAEHPLILRAIARVQSATSLRLMLRNPLAFVWRYALGWHSTMEEEEPLSLNDRAFGELVHELLRRAVDRLEPQPGYSKAAPHELEAALHEAVASTRAQWPLERSIPPTLLWAHTLEQAQRLAHRALAFEQSVQARTRCWTEVPFGQASAAIGDWPWDPRTLVVIPGTHVHVGGKIDRLDLRWDGLAVRVSDYKTGTEPKGAETIVLAGGVEIQRVIYAIATRQLLPDVRQVAARIVFLGDDAPRAHKLPNVEEAVRTISAHVLAACELLNQGRGLPSLEERKPGDDFRLALPADVEGYLRRKRAAISRLFGDFSQVWRSA